MKFIVLLLREGGNTVDAFGTPSEEPFDDEDAAEALADRLEHFGGTRILPIRGDGKTSFTPMTNTEFNAMVADVDTSTQS